MVMGPTHAMSGAAVGLAVAQALPPDWGGVTTPAEAIVYAGIGAGAALLPDLDSPQATISRSFGPLSLGLSHLVENASQLFVNATNGPRDTHCGNGHRTATHTVWFAIAMAGLAALLITVFGKPAAIGLLFFFLGLGLRGLVPEWSKKNDWLAVSGVSAAASLAVWAWVPLGAAPLVMASAVGVGVLTHIAGDALTKNGVPAVAPVPIRGKHWYDIGLPGPMRINASGGADQLLLSVCTMAVGLELWLIVSGRTVTDAATTMVAGG